jgi:ATP-dependent DNA helicase RecQ
VVLRGELERESLHLAVHELESHAAQLAWLTSTLPRLEGSGIVYCLTVAVAEQVSSHLAAAGLAVRSYTGQTDPAERLACEQDLLANRVKALVATSALGMGFDKPDLGFVVHLGAPASPIAYYQQVGRAGRATARAEVVLLPGRDDRAIWDWFASMSFPPEREVVRTLDALASADGAMSTAALEPLVGLRRNRLELMLKVLDVDGAVRRVRGGWVTTGVGWSYDAERYARVDETRRAEQQLMLDYVTTAGCRMAFLRRALDDPGVADDPGWRCGRCDRCGGVAVAPAPDEDAVAQARARLAQPGVEVTPRRQWPSGLRAVGLELSGRIPAGEQHGPGRAVARLDSLGLGGTLRTLFTAPAADEEGQEPVAEQQVPPALRQAVTDVLDTWRPEVAGVVRVVSATRPALVEHLTAGVARHLAVPVVGAVRPDPDRPPGRHDVNSAQRLAGVARRLDLDLSAAAAAGLPGRAVLLVDDRIDSGWTMTYSARLLRRAGAATVLPFALALG